MPRRLQLVDPEPRLLPEGLIPNPDPRLPPEAEDGVTRLFCRLRHADPDSRFLLPLPEGLIPKPDPRMPPEAEDRLFELYDFVKGRGGRNMFGVLCNECLTFVGSINSAWHDDMYCLHHAAKVHGVFITRQSESESERDHTQTEEDKYDEDSVKTVCLERPHLHGQTKMEEDECVDHSVKADGQTKMEEDEYVKADFSERQLHQLFMFLDAPPGHSDVLEDKKHIKRLAVVCNLCGGVPDYIQEGSSLQDRRAVQEHASLHRDVSDDLPNPWVDQSTNMEPTKPKSYSEAELLRIYVLGSFCVPGYKMHLEEFSVEIADQVWHAVICKLCYGDVYQTQDNPSGCLHKIPMLQEHASRHSEYLCIDGPSAPELDFEDYMKGWLTSDEDGFLSFEDDAPVQKGFVKICRWCKCKGCKSGNLGTVRIQCHTCGDFGAHITYECPLWEREFGRLIPCNGLKKLRTTLMESWKLPELPRAVCMGL